MDYLTTGNGIVDEVGTINFTGNIIPQIWYKTILRDNGKPNLLAISILSDIVYWYRPSEIRDEASGCVIGWKKRFRNDLLQRSYEQFAKLFGESKRSIIDAVICLEKLGVVKREFRTIQTFGDIRLNNVLYLQLDPEKLYALTYTVAKKEKNNITSKETLQKELPPAIENCDRVLQNNESLHKILW